MQTARHTLFSRPDTFLGICEGLGEDIGIHPNLLRLMLAGMLFWNPAAAFGTYLAAGAIVLVSRLLAPVPRPAQVRPEVEDEFQPELERLAA